MSTTGGARTTRRRGRMSPSKRRALTEGAPRWGLSADRLDGASLDDAFDRRNSRILDIGVGTGEATCELARTHPEQDVIAVELHQPGVARLFGAIEAQDLSNVRVLEADITAAADRFETGFTQIRILFPDPWPKRRHRSRRLVDDRFTASIVDLLEPGGLFHVATDWDDYADQVREVLGAQPLLEPLPGADTDDPWVIERPERPVTTYEQRGIDAGRTITDLAGRRR